MFWPWHPVLSLILPKTMAYLSFFTRTTNRTFLAFSILLFLSLPSHVRSQTCDSPCLHGGTCQVDSLGKGYCECPSPTPLHPIFYRGPHCETRAEQCSDSETFFCANGAYCIEIVQGEKYYCKNCTEPWGGDNCAVQGEECGDKGLFCHNGGQCNVFGSCSCPKEWRGSGNCGVRTQADGSTQGSTNFGGESEGTSVVLLILIIFLVLVCLLLIGRGVYFFLSRRKAQRLVDDMAQDDVIFLQDEDDNRHDAILELSHSRKNNNSSNDLEEGERVSLRPGGTASDD